VYIYLRRQIAPPSLQGGRGAMFTPSGGAVGAIFIKPIIYYRCLKQFWA